MSCQSSSDDDLKLQIENQCTEIASEFFNIAAEPELWINGEDPATDGPDFEIASKFIYLIALENCYSEKQDILNNLLYPLWRMIVTGSSGNQSWKYPYEVLCELGKKSTIPENDILLGNIHELGLCDTKIDTDKAIDYYCTASLENDCPNNYNFARLFYWGMEEPRNQKYAFKLLTQNPLWLSEDALNLLGIMYLDGISTTPDYEMALEAFELASSFMYGRSLCNYGLMRYCGVGCTPDKKLGRKLLEMAEFSGSEKAQKYLEDITNDMPIDFNVECLDVAPAYFGEYLKKIRNNAESGSLKDMIRLAEIYYLPEVFNFACMEEAYRWYFMAARMGSLYAAIQMKDLSIYVHKNDLNEVNEILAHTDFAESWIKDKILMTSLVEPYSDVLELPEEEEMLQRKRFCPTEALYWQLIERKDETYYRGWHDWLKSRDKKLTEFCRKISVSNK